MSKELTPDPSAPEVFLRLFRARERRVEQDFEHFMRIRPMLSSDQRRIFVQPVFDEAKRLLDEFPKALALERRSESDLPGRRDRLAEIHRELRTIVSQK
jgi:hypothetical protein